jgi:hypothetical protein
MFLTKDVLKVLRQIGNGIAEPCVLAITWNNFGEVCDPLATIPPLEIYALSKLNEFSRQLVEHVIIGSTYDPATDNVILQTLYNHTFLTLVDNDGQQKQIPNTRQTIKKFQVVTSPLLL